MKQFLKDNQVLLSGLAGAVILVLQQFVGTAAFNWKVVLLALGVGVGGFLGNNLKGKGVSVAGLIGTAGTSIATIAATGEFSWTQFAITFAIGFLALVAHPATDAK